MARSQGLYLGLTQFSSRRPLAPQQLWTTPKQGPECLQCWANCTEAHLAGRSLKLQPAGTLPLKSQVALFNPEARLLSTKPDQPLSLPNFSVQTGGNSPGTPCLSALQGPGCSLCRAGSAEAAPAVQQLPMLGPFDLWSPCHCRFCSCSELALQQCVFLDERRSGGMIWNITSSPQ